MKITWFGGSTFRLYIGGKIFVTDAARAPEGVDRHEVAAAADRLVDLSDGIADFPYLDTQNWWPRKPLRPLDMPEEQLFELYTISGEALFIDEPEEGPVIITPAGKAVWGRFADNAVVIFYGSASQLVGDVQNLMQAARPKLIIIALDGLDDALFDQLADASNQTALQVLEPGLAIEV